MARIAVLTHSKDDFESRHYFLALLVECWKNIGIEIVVLRGTDHFVPADALILHVNMTVIPGAYDAFACLYPVVINGRVADISKRNVSTHIIGPKDPHAGPVIVKTDLNYGGLPEMKLERPGPWCQLAGKILNKLPWTVTGNIHPSAYPIFPDPRSVPRLAWLNPRLVVEKYLPEREGDYYCVRHWVFFGDQEYNFRAFSHEPIVKARNTVHRERGLPVPEPLRVLRAKLAFDYGKFDYAVVNGETVLYDANRTPTIPPNAVDKGKAIARELMAGLYTFIDLSGKNPGSQ